MRYAPPEFAFPVAVTAVPIIALPLAIPGGTLALTRRVVASEGTGQHVRTRARPSSFVALVTFAAGGIQDC